MEREFSDSCLPLTMELANRNKGIIIPVLSNISSSLPFNDRVIIWLLPIFEKEVKKFHDGDGPSMREILKPWQIETLDSHLLKLLPKTIKGRKLMPAKRPTKPGCVSFLFRDFDKDLYERIRKLANGKGLTIKTWVYMACAREVERQEGEK